MNTTYYITEIDGKPIIGGGWYENLEGAKNGARHSVTNAPEPTYVAVVGDFDVEFSVARQDHPEARHADEVQVSPEVHISLADFHIGQRVRVRGGHLAGDEGVVIRFTKVLNETDRNNITAEHVAVVRFPDNTPESGDEWMLPTEIEAVTA